MKSIWEMREKELSRITMRFLAETTEWLVVPLLQWKAVERKH